MKMASLTEKQNIELCENLGIALFKQSNTIKFKVDF